MNKILVSVFCLALVACGGNATLPAPNTPKTAGVEALVAYGLASHVANQYLGLPLCTKPLTAVPCKTQVIADKVKAADVVAYNAAIAADDAANAGNVAVQQKAQTALADLKQVNTEANGGKQ